MYQASKWLFLSASYLVLLWNSGDFDKGGGYCALIIAHLPLLACISACQPTSLLLSSHSSRSFSDSRTLWSQRQSRFAFQWKPFVPAVIRSSISSIHRASLRSPRIDASVSSSARLRAGRESHCPLLPAGVRSAAASIAQPSSRQYLGTLPAARYRDLSRAAMHNNRFYWLEWRALLAMTPAHHSLLNSCFFSPPPTIFLFSHKAPNSAINATHFNRTSICPKERRGGIRVRQS